MSKLKKPGHYLSDAIKDGQGSSIYISYCRKDKSFVKAMYDGLTVDGREVFVEWEDVAAAASEAEQFEEIKENIERRDCFLLVLTPDSVLSSMCDFELDNAQKQGKRIIPVVARDVDYRSVRKDIQTLNWIFFREDVDDFQHALKLLVKSLDNELLHVRLHSLILGRASEWQKRDYEKSLLMMGGDLKVCQQWLSQSALGKSPQPTLLHLSYIKASNALAESMLKRRVVAMFFAFILAIGVIWPGWGVFFFALVFSHFFVYISSN